MIINNVEIVDQYGRRKGNILVKDGIIVDTNVKGNYENHQVIDGSDYTLMPSFIDMHTHLRDPGFEYKEDMETGMRAALKGGYTHLAAMANTNPITDNFEMVVENLSKSKELNLCNLTQICALTKDFGEEFVDLEKIIAVTKVFSNDGKTVAGEDIMREGLKRSKELGFVLATHCEPEVEIVKRDLNILREVPGNLHICHVSEKETLNLIRKAKKEGLHFTCEVTPHHVFDNDVDYKVSPPFGTRADRQALIEGIKDGIIDLCATDHAPHSKEDKEKGSPGISNIEVAFSMYWKVFHEENIPLEKLSQMMSYQPAKILGLNCGEIVVGREANVVLIDENKETTIDIKGFVSKSNNNPFHGRKVKGKVMMTIKRGEVIYDNR
ncbi:dihydroorotase [Alkalibaculum bacchi]|uniref:dihydroorotase n=1 Tax=Alkalibaculum bacchi TaxID=645887 RepID=UPI0026F19768|nr:dihydroorotase [Alkalibaculum bacchi]